MAIKQKIYKLILENSWGNNQPAAIFLGIEEATLLKLELALIDKEYRLMEFKDLTLYGVRIYFTPHPGIKIAFSDFDQAMHRSFRDSKENSTR